MGTYCGLDCGVTRYNCEGSCGNCSPCNSCQGFCLVGTQYGYQLCGASGAPTIQRDDIIIKKLPKTKVQALMNWLYQVSAKGSKSQSGPKSATVNSSDFLHASDLNQILAQLKTLNDVNPGSDYARDQIIYGSEMNRIMTLIRNAQVDGSGCAGGAACDKCNMQCNSCVSCNSCS